RGPYTSRLWRPARGEGPAWHPYCLCGTHPSDLTADECTLSPQELTLFQASAVVAGSFQLGGLDLQFDASREDVAGGMHCLLWATTLASTHPCYGCRIHRSSLDGEGVVDDCCASYRHQHKIGRLPARLTWKHLALAGVMLTSIFMNFGLGGVAEW